MIPFRLLPEQRYIIHGSLHKRDECKLITYRLPKIVVDEDEEIEVSDDPQETTPVDVTHVPITVTLTKVTSNRIKSIVLIVDFRWGRSLLWTQQQKKRLATE